jgi:hypothetical protein
MLCYVYLIASRKAAAGLSCMEQILTAAILSSSDEMTGEE